jgi:hypothetical protein
LSWQKDTAFVMNIDHSEIYAGRVMAKRLSLTALTGPGGLVL